MTLKEAQAKLDEISRSTGTKHVKVLIAELCVVIKYLLDDAQHPRMSRSPLFAADPGVKVDPAPRRRKPFIEPMPPQDT